MANILNALLPVVTIVIVGAIMYYAFTGMQSSGSRAASATSFTGSGSIAEADVFPKYMANKRTINRLNRTAPIREGLSDRPAYGKRLGNYQDPRQDRGFTDRIANRLARQLQSADQDLLFEKSEDMQNALSPNSSLALR